MVPIFYNIIDYEKTLTVEAALAAQSSSEEEIAKPKKEKKTKKQNDIKSVAVTQLRFEQPQQLGDTPI